MFRNRAVDIAVRALSSRPLAAAAVLRTSSQLATLRMKYSQATQQHTTEVPGPGDPNSSARASDSDQAASKTAPEAGPQRPYADLSQEELQLFLKERDAELEAQKLEAEDLSQKLVRTLADMENLRQRSSRQAENTKQYAIQGFVESLLDVGDNLERAASAVPEGALSGKGEDGRDLNPDHLVTLLTGLVNGIKLTEKIFDQALRKNGVEKYRPHGEQFDPNKHEALFEMTDPSKVPGTVGTVSKTGYALNGRVVRPAQVGVVRAAML